MASDLIRYDLLTQQALREVVRSVLADAAKKGLPGEHHFYISFDTQAEGVKLSQRLRTQYPGEMTIILQHQFWDLTVSDDRFEIGLSFNGIPERLTVPLASIKSFVDPSAQFALQFEENADAADAEDAARAGESNSNDVKTGAALSEAPERPSNKNTAPTSAPVPIPANPQRSTETDPADRPATGGAEVVRLDRFRKK